MSKTFSHAESTACFFSAGVPEIEASTDLALAETMYRAAAKFGVKYVIEGHSFIAEGISPLGKNYFDGKYIKSIHKKYGRLPLKTYPLMTFWKFIKWTTFYRIISNHLYDKLILLFIF